MYVSNRFDFFSLYLSPSLLSLSLSLLLLLLSPGHNDSLDSNSLSLDPIEMQKYTMQALKRNHCQRLSCFIRLCDYVILSMLHDLTLDSEKHLLQSLRERASHVTEIEDFAEPIPDDEEEDEKVLLLPLKTPSSSVQNTPSVRILFIHYYLYIYAFLIMPTYMYMYSLLILPPPSLPPSLPLSPSLFISFSTAYWW